MTPTATRLKLRLDERHAWFRNQWFFKWHHIGGEQTVEIDLFDGRHAYYAGICYSGSPQTVYWDAVARGVRKEIIEQFAWIEEAIRPYAREVALQALDECSGQLISFAHRIRRTAVEKDRILRGDGVRFPEPYDAGLWDGAEAQDINAQAQGLKRALFPIAEPRTTETPLNVPSPSTNRAYQVALSFAGEQRDYVDEVARWLAAKRIAVFYDKFEAVNLWGKDGVEHFHQVFAQDAQYVVMFISAEYVAKSWTRHERRAALSRQIAEDSEYVLPVRFDATEVPGIPSTLQYLDAKSLTPAELAALIAQKVGHGHRLAKLLICHHPHHKRWLVRSPLTTARMMAGSSLVAGHAYSRPCGLRRATKASICTMTRHQSMASPLQRGLAILMPSTMHLTSISAQGAERPAGRDSHIAQCQWLLCRRPSYQGGRRHSGRSRRRTYHTLPDTDQRLSEVQSRDLASIRRKRFRHQQEGLGRICGKSG